MKKSLKLIGVLSILCLYLFSSCRSDFEIIRSSNDPEKILTEANALYKKGDYHKAITLYEILIPAYRGRSEAEDIAYNYADAHYKLKRYISSAHYFKQFASTYNNSPRKEEADFLSAYSNVELSPSDKLDQSSSIKAIDALQTFINAYPTSPRVDQCNELIDEMRKKMENKAYSSAKLYYDLKNYSSSIVSFENMLKDYPETNKEEEIRYLVAKSSFSFAENSVYAKKKERYMTTMEKCELFLKKFPKGNKLSEVNTFITKSKQELNKIDNG